MADKVGKKTGLVTNYGRPVYEMDDGSRVSEISDTFKYKGKIINIPTIHGGRQYSQNELIDMLDAKDIKPTSTHSTFEEAEKAARERSDNMTMHKAKASGGVMMAQQGQTTLPMTQATSAPQGGGPKAANPAAVNPLVAPQQQSARPGEVDPRDGAVQEVAAEMQKKNAPPQPAIQQVGQEMVMSTPPAQPQTGGLAAPAQPPAVPMMAKGGMKDDAPEGLAVMIGLGAPTPSYEEAAEGNPPPGATKEEVADDQLVLLSEGELVVPANVVRYHGLGTYEGMRREALMGLQGMEQNGQIEYVSGGAEKADPVDDNGGLIKAQAGTTLIGANPSIIGPGIGRGPLMGPITTPEAASSRFVTTPGQQRGIGTPTTDVTPLTMRGNLPPGAQIDPATGLLIYPTPGDADKQLRYTPTTQGAGLTSIVAPNVGQYKEDTEPEPEPEPDPEPAPDPTPAPAPQPDSGSDDRDDNAPNVTASAAHGYQNVSANLTGLAKGLLGPFGNLLGEEEGTKKDVYGQVAVGTGAVYGEANVPGADGGQVAQGHNPITGQRMAVFSDRPSAEFFAKSAGKALGLKGSEDFRPFNEPLDYNNPSPLGAMGIASTLDKAISNTKGQDITQFQGAAQERMTAEGQTYAPQDITAEMLGFDKSKASYSLAANNSGKIGNSTGDIVATSTSVGVLNDSNQIETAQGTVVQVTFKDGSKGSLLGSALDNKDVITRYNAEKGIDSRQGSSSSYLGDILPSDRRGTATEQTTSEQTNRAFGAAAVTGAPSRASGQAFDDSIARAVELAKGERIAKTANALMAAGMPSGQAFQEATYTETTGEVSPSAQAAFGQTPTATKASLRNDDEDRPSGREYGGFDSKTVQEETQKTQESYEEAAGINQSSPPPQDSDDGGGSDPEPSKIVCTEMYRQTQLEDWARTMKIWDTYQKKYLTPIHEVGYHWLFKPYVRGMQKSGILTNVGAFLAQKRTQHLRHILTKGRAKDSFVGNVWCKIIHPIVYLVGKIVSKK